jgi:TrpR family trp operon transcriptional repressor
MESDTKLVHDNIAEMATAISHAEAPELIEGFLYSLFTPAEADEIAKRWALVKALSQGRPQREIAKDLGLSLCKITRGSRELKKADSPWRKMLSLAGYEVPAKLPGKRGAADAAELPQKLSAI